MMDRRNTRCVRAGAVPIGGGAPVSVQSMTNTDTRDVEATVAQIHELERAGCELVRVSVYDMDCARAILAIRRAIHIPLVADIHFDHRLAIAAAENGVDKLRINPGNIGGQAHVEKLVDCASCHHIPIRIGVNAGSLEADLKRQYGPNSPQAMVESALRHIRMLERAHFQDIVVSLKSSTVSTTVAAYRLLSQTVDYPLHIGITETGSVERGILKSAIGIGALLLDGIGDTLRVSLTDTPVREVQVGLELLRALRLREDEGLGWGVISGAWASGSYLAIAPLQDVLGLGGDARMNTPGTVGDHNWSWRVRADALNPYVSGKLREITRTYRRCL